MSRQEEIPTTGASKREQQRHPRRSLAQDAVQLAVHGFRVYPATPGRKRPLFKGWQKAASADPCAVADTWREHPEANIGIKTGGGLFVVDADSAHAVDRLRDLGIPETMAAETPQGGQHFYLRAEGYVPTQEHVLSKVDIRGDGRGAAIAASSIGQNGERYRWLVAPWELGPQPAPLSILELARSPKPVEAVAPGAKVPVGRRQNHLVRRAGQLVRLGIQGEALREALLTINATELEEPQPSKKIDGIIKSAKAWETIGLPPWAIDPVRFSEDARLDRTSRHLLLIACHRADPAGRFRGGDWLLKVSGIGSRQTLHTGFKKLIAIGRIRLLERGSGPGKANVYQLVDRSLPSGGSKGAQELTHSPGRGHEPAHPAPDPGTADPLS